MECKYKCWAKFGVAMRIFVRGYAINWWFIAETMCHPSPFVLQYVT
jgi:hypothetical protein